MLAPQHDRELPVVVQICRQQARGRGKDDHENPSGVDLQPTSRRSPASHRLIRSSSQLAIQVVYRHRVPRFLHANYIDFDEVFEPDDGYRGVLRLKGEGFRHENEVRGINIARSPNLEDKSDQRLASLSETYVIELLSKSPGFNLSVNLATLLGEIRLSPGADDSYVQEVRELLAAKGLSWILVRRSELEGRGADVSASKQ